MLIFQIGKCNAFRDLDGLEDYFLKDNAPTWNGCKYFRDGPKNELFYFASH